MSTGAVSRPGKISVITFIIMYIFQPIFAQLGGMKYQTAPKWTQDSLWLCTKSLLERSLWERIDKYMTEWFENNNWVLSYNLVVFLWGGKLVCLSVYFFHEAARFGHRTLAFPLEGSSWSSRNPSNLLNYCTAPPLRLQPVRCRCYPLIGQTEVARILALKGILSSHTQGTNHKETDPEMWLHKN